MENPLNARGCFIYARDTGRFLFLLNNDCGRFAYMWGIPGGKQEPGESARDCIVREIEEETGYKILTNFIPVESYTNDRGSFSYSTYFCSVNREFIPTLSDEHCGYCWVPLDNFPRPMHIGVYNCMREELTRDILKELIK